MKSMNSKKPLPQTQAGKSTSHTRTPKPLHNKKPKSHTHTPKPMQNKKPKSHKNTLKGKSSNENFVSSKKASSSAKLLLQKPRKGGSVDVLKKKKQEGDADDNKHPKADVKQSEELNGEGFSSSKKRKMEWRERKAKRKQLLPGLWEAIRTIQAKYGVLIGSVKSKSPGEVKERVTELLATLLTLESLRNGMDKKKVYNNPSVSRAFQACLKHGSAEHRKKIWLAISKADDLAQLASEKYSHNLVMKLYLYCDKEAKNEVCEKICAKEDTFFSKYGSKVWEYLYTQDISPTRQRKMLYKVMIPNSVLLLKFGSAGLSVLKDTHTPSSAQTPSQTSSSFGGGLLSLPFLNLLESLDSSSKASLSDHLLQIISKATDKELLDRSPVHSIIRYATLCIPEEKLSELMEVISEGAFSLTTTKAGVEALVVLLGYANAKQRKKFINSLKGKIAEMAKNQVDYLLIIRLLAIVDDTKLLETAILKAAATPSFYSICSTNLGRKFFHQVYFPGDSRFFTEYELKMIQLPSPTSLKDTNTRTRELKEKLTQLLLEELLNKEDKQKKDSPSPSSCLNWMKNEWSRTVFVELVKQTKDSRLIELILKDIGDELLSCGEKLGPDSLIDHTFGHYTLIQLINVASEVGLSACDGSSFCVGLWKLLEPRTHNILLTRGVFVVAKLLDSSNADMESVKSDIKRSLTGKVVENAKSQAEEAGLKCTGLNLLLPLVSAP